MTYATGEEVKIGDMVKVIKRCLLCGNRTGFVDKVVSFGEYLITIKTIGVGHDNTFFEFISRREKLVPNVNMEDK